MGMYPQIGMRVDSEFLNRVDAWRLKQPDFPNRSEAVRRLVDAMLQILEKKPRATLLEEKGCQAKPQGGEEPKKLFQPRFPVTRTIVSKRRNLWRDEV